MNQAEITAAVRTGISEPKPRRVTDVQIASMTLRAVRLLGLRIKEKDPSYFNARKSLQSNTHVFSIPSACKKINNIWDYDGNAIAITATANNGSGLIRVTAADHGLEDNAIVTVHDVGGCTEANGTWKIDYVDENTFDLLGSVYANAYTSGGYVFLEKTGMLEIAKINMSEQSGDSPSKWYPRKGVIVIDDPGFTDDIIIDYEGAADAITDIPDEYHEFLPSWVIVNLLEIPKPDAPDYADVLKVKNLHETVIKIVLEDVSRTMKQSSGPTFIRNVWSN
ncbi:MAG TPA: hypothetical protein DDY86_09320 [Syntrophaceae bacterium]|nr:hypothetical protein [Syntrophaceae bacterium]